jgi:hypothetical protein
MAGLYRPEFEIVLIYAVVADEIIRDLSPSWSISAQQKTNSEAD